MPRQPVISPPIWAIEEPAWDSRTPRTQYYWSPYNLTDRPLHSCPKCGRDVGTLADLAPYTLDCQGQKVGLSDFSPQGSHFAIITTPVLNWMRRDRITGWRYTAKALIVKGRPKELIAKDPVRHYIEIRWSKVRIDERASEFARTRPIRCFHCSQGISGYKRLVFEEPLPARVPDLFACYNLPHGMFCTQRFRKKFHSHGFNGIEFHDPKTQRWWEKESFLGGEMLMTKIKAKDQAKFIKDEWKRYPTDDIE